MFHFWLVWRYLKGGAAFLNLTTFLALLGMALGVASLVVAMAVVSGYESTLRRTVIDMVGHVLVIKRGKAIKASDAFVKTELLPQLPNYQAHSPFVYLEGILAHKGKLLGVFLEGVDPASVVKVLGIQNRIIDGEFDLSPVKDKAAALIGKGISKRFDLKVGDSFTVVLPINEGYDSEKFRRKVKRFSVKGILDLGRHDYDSRYIITALDAAQDFGELGDGVTGLRLRLDRDDQAKASSLRLSTHLGYSYVVRDWTEVNKNLFEAIRLERAVIFFVLMIMVLAACFNISSTLYVSVLRRFGDISILKTMGADKAFIRKIFTRQGMIIGFLGAFIGTGLGLLACYGFLYAQTRWNLIPGEVYKLDKLDVEIEWFDLGLIFGASFIICYLSTLAPARRGAKLDPVEGLRYE